MLFSPNRLVMNKNIGEVKMQNIMVVYGGKSVEHDISILTAIQVMQNLDKNKYNIIPVYQTPNFEFIVVSDYLNPKVYIGEIKKFKKVNFVFGKGDILIGKLKKRIHIHCAVNCFHGINGEDGTMNAFFNICQIPITSPSLLSSSVCMDKVIMKDIFVANNIPCVKYALVTQNDYLTKNIEQKIVDLTYPLIVKPANLGSSIGINKVTNLKELYEAVEIALYYDSRVIVENCLEDFKEINISCLGDEEVEFSKLEQPMSWKNFLNFDNKYTQKDAQKIVDPKLEKPVIDKIHEISKLAWRTFDLYGVVRMDFMVQGEEVYLNEINTVPGSLAFYLWKGKYDFFELLDKIIIIAIAKFNQKNKHKYTFTSSVLADYKPNSMNKYAK